MLINMSFTEYLRKKADPLWKQEHDHPFVVGIGNGTLPADRFEYYLKQDYVFLIEFSRVIAIAVAKAPTPMEMTWFSELLNETLHTEMDLHISYCQDFGLSKDEILSTPMSPTTHSYTRHMLEAAYSGNFLDAAVGILPCSWGYSEIGKSLLSKGLPAHSPHHSRWIEMYSSPEFESLAVTLRDIIDKATVGLPDSRLIKLEEIFIMSSRYEYRFWEAAYTLESW